MDYPDPIETRAALVAAMLLKGRTLEELLELQERVKDEAAWKVFGAELLELFRETQDTQKTLPSLGFCELVAKRLMMHLEVRIPAMQSGAL